MSSYSRNNVIAPLLILGCFATVAVTADDTIYHPTDSAALDSTAHPALVFESPLPKTRLTVVYCLLILLASTVGLFALKRGRLPSLKKGREEQLSIVETRMLGNRQFLIVAEYAGRRMLLGVGPGAISHLCFLDSDSVQGSRFKSVLGDAAEDSA